MFDYCFQKKASGHWIPWMDIKEKVEHSSGGKVRIKMFSYISCVVIFRCCIFIYITIQLQFFVVLCNSYILIYMDMNI